MPFTQSIWSGIETEFGSTLESLHIDTIGYSLRKHEQVDATFGFEGCALILRGCGGFRVGHSRTVRLTAPAVFFIRPNVHYRYGPDPGTTWEEHYVCFSGLRVRNWRRRGWLTPPYNPVPLLETQRFVQSHQKICRAFPPRQSIPIDEAKLELERMIWDLHQQSGSHTTTKSPLEPVVQAWIDAPPSEIDLAVFAHSLGMSYNGFRAAFEKRTGLPPYQFLLRSRMDKACRLLRETDLPVKAVAGEIGFGHVESFCRAFLRIKAVSPGEFRKRLTAFTPSPRAGGSLKITRKS